MTYGRAATVATVVSLLLACEPRDEASSSRHCRFGLERAVATTSGDIDGAAWLPARGDAVVWSDEQGLHMQPLAPGSFRPTGAMQTWGPRCRGGLATSTLPSKADLVACLVAGDEAKGEDGSLVAWVVDVRHVRVRKLLMGGLGAASRSPAIAWESRGSERIVVAWVDVDHSDRIARLARFGPSGAIEDDHALSDVSALASAPSFARDSRGNLHAVFAAVQARPHATGFAGSVYVTSLDGGSPTALEEVATDTDVAPRIAVGRDGTRTLVFRDERPVGSKVGAFALQLDGSLSRRGTPTRVGRANAPDSPPAALACTSALTVVSPRTHSRDLLIDVERLGARSLLHLGAELQIYEYGAHLTHADAHCAPDDALAVLYASRSRVEGKASTIRAITLRCGS